MDTDKTNKSATYKCVMRVEVKLCLPAQLVAATGLCIGLYYSLQWYWLVVICLPFEVASVAVLWWSVIEPANGVLRERALLFGKKLLAERVTPLSEFSEIFYEYAPSDSGDGSFRLGLRHQNGRKFWIEGKWTIRRAVEETAWDISCKTGVRLSEWPA